MSIRKTKSSPLDINGLMTEIDADHQIAEASVKVDQRLEELKAAQETLKQATSALNNAVIAINDARSKSNEIVSGISQAIDRAQKTSVITVEVNPQTKEHLQKINHDFLVSESQLLKEHIVRQHQDLIAHEDNIQKMLRNNEGIWLSNFWLKVLIGGIVVYTIVTLLCYVAK